MLGQPAGKYFPFRGGLPLATGAGCLGEAEGHHGTLGLVEMTADGVLADDEGHRVVIVIQEQVFRLDTQLGAGLVAVPAANDLSSPDGYGFARAVGGDVVPQTFEVLPGPGREDARQGLKGNRCGVLMLGPPMVSCGSGSYSGS